MDVERPALVQGMVSTCQGTVKVAGGIDMHADWRTSVLVVAQVTCAKSGAHGQMRFDRRTEIPTHMHTRRVNLLKHTRSLLQGHPVV
jgi:hypothetical protein